MALLMRAGAATVVGTAVLALASPAMAATQGSGNGGVTLPLKPVVLGETLTRAPAATTGTAPTVVTAPKAAAPAAPEAVTKQLAFTGSDDVVGGLILGGLLLAGGSTLIVAGRRKHARA